MIQKALLVVDVQNDFCPCGALAVTGGDNIVALINKVLKLFYQNDWPTHASRDWHPPDTEHFKEWPVHCIANTRGAEFHPNLKISGRTYVIDKGTDKNSHGYSPFEGKSYGRSLNEILQAFKVTELFVCGLATDYCVKHACLDARRLGYTVYLMTDACRAVNVNDPNAAWKSEPEIIDIIYYLSNTGKPVTDENIALRQMKRAGVIFTTTDEVLTQVR